MLRIKFVTGYNRISEKQKANVKMKTVTKTHENVTKAAAILAGIAMAAFIYYVVFVWHGNIN